MNALEDHRPPAWITLGVMLSLRQKQKTAWANVVVVRHVRTTQTWPISPHWTSKEVTAFLIFLYGVPDKARDGQNAAVI